VHLHARPAAGAIARLIHDPSPDVRRSVVEALGNLGAQSGAAAVTDALSDAHPDVRHAALGALNDLKAPIAEATLVNLMKDPAARWRRGAPGGPALIPRGSRHSSPPSRTPTP